MKLGQLGASFRDPSGFLFRQGNELYRQINTRYKNKYEWLKSSGLYDKLATREDIFQDYNIVGFEDSLSGYFRILEKTTIEGTERTLYMLEQI